MCSCEIRPVLKECFSPPLGVVWCYSGVKITHDCSFFPHLQVSRIPLLPLPITIDTHPVLPLLIFLLLPILSFSHDCTEFHVSTDLQTPILIHTFVVLSLLSQEFLTLFTVCFAFEQGVRLSSGREEEHVS